MNGSSRESTVHADAQLALVRELLSGHIDRDVRALRAQLEALEARLVEPEAFAQHVAEALPMAMQRAHQPRSRRQLEEALGHPWIGAARYAAENQLPAASDALAPMLLPAIAMAVKERINAFSRAIQRASPMRRIGWKIKSLQTGLPLESVIEQDLDPFVVHRVLAVEMPSGNLLAAHRARAADDDRGGGEPEDEAYATAALLTAMRGFVRDAGIGEHSGDLTSIEVGRRTLHIAQQGSILVAVEASGQLAHDIEPSLHAELIPALRRARTQAEREQALATWRSDAPRHRRRTGGLSFGGIVILLMGVLLLMVWGANRAVERRDVHVLMNRIANTPGVLSASLQRTDAGWVLRVAADPSVNIAGTVAAAMIPADRLAVQVEPVLSLDPTVMAGVLRSSLPTPQGTMVTVGRDAIRVDGRVSAAYLEQLRAHPRVRVANIPVILAPSATVVTP